MNYCPNCGNQLPQGASFCTKCGGKLGVYQQPQQAQISPEDDKKANNLSLISLGLFFGPSALSILSAGISASTSAGSRITAISSALSGVCTLAAIVLMIVARVKYPKNKLAKIVMWIYIALFAIGIIGSVLLILACAYACRNC
ncbi:MAG: zinc-ribbon domain-containing protein [Bacilli bacterium]|nr:zinc-ribbon domain-containing protein [Bacilli bacterium]